MVFFVLRNPYGVCWLRWRHWHSQPPFHCEHMNRRLPLRVRSLAGYHSSRIAQLQFNFGVWNAEPWPPALTVLRSVRQENKPCHKIGSGSRLNCECDRLHFLLYCWWMQPCRNVERTDVVRPLGSVSSYTAWQIWTWTWPQLRPLYFKVTQVCC